MADTTYKISLLPGDGIGPEIIADASTAADHKLGTSGMGDKIVEYFKRG